jgi:uncharacterized protein YgfB (UPF0149 family)
MTQNRKSDRRAAGERRTKARSGRRESDNQEERDRRVTQILEYLKRQTRAADFESTTVLPSNVRDPKR